MNPLIFDFPSAPPTPRRARPGIDLPMSDLARLIEAGELKSFIACKHSDTPFPDYWYLYGIGQPVDDQAGKCLGIVCIYADRPLAVPSLDEVVGLLQDVGFDDLLQVCPEPMPVEIDQ